MLFDITTTTQAGRARAYLIELFLDDRRHGKAVPRIILGRGVPSFMVPGEYGILLIKIAVYLG